jgi:hypothetical protein
VNLLTTEWDFRSLWALLPLLTKIYLASLFAFACYTAVSLVATGLRLLAVAKKVNQQSEGSAEYALNEVAIRVRNLQQMNLLLFLIFGVYLADHSYSSMRALRNSMLSLQAAGLEVFAPLAAVSFVVFVVLAALHSMSWIVAVRIESELLNLHAIRQ